MKENIFPDKVFSHFTSHFSLKRPAFTLADVLITLGIIGVVAAMTMPSLIQNYQVKETVSRLKKFTSIMNNTILMAKNDYGEIDSWDFILSTNDENNNANASTVEGLDNFIKNICYLILNILNTISSTKVELVIYQQLWAVLFSAV